MHGKSGVGKTRTSYELGKELELSGKTPYIKSRYDSQNLNWYCGYDQHQVLIFDDVRLPFFKDLSNVLQILDRYPVILPQKYGSRQLVAKYIFITAPFKPEYYIHNPDEDERNSNIQQLLRRIDHVYEVTNDECWILFSANSFSINRDDFCLLVKGERSQAENRSDQSLQVKKRGRPKGSKNKKSKGVGNA